MASAKIRIKKNSVVLSFELDDGNNKIPVDHKPERVIEHLGLNPEYDVLGMQHHEREANIGIFETLVKSSTNTWVIWGHFKEKTWVELVI